MYKISVHIPLVDVEHCPLIVKVQSAVSSLNITSRERAIVLEYVNAYCTPTCRTHTTSRHDQIRLDWQDVNNLKIRHVTFRGLARLLEILIMS